MSWATKLSHDLRGASALVVDGNPTSRSILISQLRDLGADRTAQASRIADARRQLEFRTFDVVVCEQTFATDVGTGQDLLDDLRRCGLLPFATVFIMVTAEAKYSKVAEAAESALDSYLLKPYNAARLEERIFQARKRKASLQAIFAAIEKQAFQEAAALCQARFEARGDYWLYAARVGAELMLRTEQYDKAQQLYEAVIEAKTLPWAKLGVARVQLETGQTPKAASTLDGLISSDPGYADAYDVMGRAQIELGNFEAALQSYKMATDMTPASISRLQRHGMLAHYCGDAKLAEELLGRSVRLGLDSKMFDAQSLVLLGFMRYHNGDRKGVLRCLDDTLDMTERHTSSLRLQRLSEVLQILLLIMDHQVAKVVEQTRAMLGQIAQENFDFEAACNLLTLLSLMAQKSIQLEEVQPKVRQLGLRFCTSRAVAELLAKAAVGYPPYADSLATIHTEVVHMIEQAMRHTLSGQPRNAVLDLMNKAENTLNAKMIESAWGVLKRYEARIDDAAQLQTQVQAFRTRFMTHLNKPALGDKGLRQSGGVSLRVMDLKPPDSPAV
jgi:CheY-like chemotaxis protein